MKKLSKRVVIILLLCLGVVGWTSCKKKPEDITRQIISDLLDTCKAGKNEDAAKHFNEILPDEEKGRAIDVASPDGKQKAERLCRDINQKYGAGYEFGTMETQRDMIGWKVFPKGSNEGQMWAFKQVNNRWTLVDVDPAKR
jgi:hypothetical protein